MNKTNHTPINNLDFAPLLKPPSFKKLYKSYREKWLSGLSGLMSIAIPLFLIFYCVARGLPLLLAVTTVSFFWFSIHLGLIVRHRRKMILESFASVNGAQYLDEHSIDATVSKDSEDRIFAATLFNQGYAHAMDAIHFPIPNGMSGLNQIGNYSYKIGVETRNNRDLGLRFKHGFIRIQISRKLPHIILDSKSNNFLGMSKLPAGIKRAQTLSLEGDFDKYFELYVPEGYERDALYIFTPDVMQVLVDDLKGFDIEILENQVYLYTSRQFKWKNAKNLKRLIELGDAFSAIFNNQTSYYHDAAVTSRMQNIIAKPGRRLYRNILFEKLSGPIVAFVVIPLLFVMGVAMLGILMGIATVIVELITS